MERGMSLADASHGPAWVGWAALVILVIFTIILLTGRGGWLIAGYNTASKEEKKKYDERKLSRTVGVGMGIISLTILVMLVFETVLPVYFAYIALGIIVLVCVLIIIFGNRWCKK